MLNFETLTKYLQAILNHYENDNDIIKDEDLKKFSKLINEFDDEILDKSWIEYLTYFICRDEKITVKHLENFINNCYLA